MTMKEMTMKEMTMKEVAMTTKRTTTTQQQNALNIIATLRLQWQKQGCDISESAEE